LTIVVADITKAGAVERAVGASEKAPEAAAAAHGAPPASLITVPAGRRALPATVMTRCTLALETPQRHTMTRDEAHDTPSNGPRHQAGRPAARRTEVPARRRGPGRSPVRPGRVPATPGYHGPRR